MRQQTFGRAHFGRGFFFVDHKGPTIELNSAAIRGALSFV